MTDIFLSYTEKDREAARRVASTLEAVGWTVWWDRRIPAGETWRSVLEDALEEMRCMVVLWSSRSIESEWVCEEASEGRRLRKLVPVMIEAVRPPAGFREIQAADLTGWDGSRDFDGMRMLIADLETLLGKPVAPASSARQNTADHGQAYDPADLDSGREGKDGWRRYRTAIVATAGVLLTVGGAYLALSTRQPAMPAAQTTQPEAARQPAVPDSPVTRPAPEPTAPPIVTVAPEAPASAAASAVDKPSPRIAPVSPRPTAATHATSARCADLLYKIQLGESLSDADRTLFRKACQQ